MCAASSTSALLGVCVELVMSVSLTGLIELVAVEGSGLTSKGEGTKGGGWEVVGLALSRKDGIGLLVVIIINESSSGTSFSPGG